MGRGAEVQQPDATAEQEQHGRGQRDQQDADPGVADVDLVRTLVDAALEVGVPLAVVGAVQELLPAVELVALGDVALDGHQLQRVEGPRQEELGDQAGHDADDQQFELSAADVVGDVGDVVARTEVRHGVRQVEEPPDQQPRGHTGGQEGQGHPEGHVPDGGALALLEADGQGADEQRHNEADQDLPEVVPRVDPPGRFGDRAQGREEPDVEQVVDVDRQPVPGVLQPDVEVRAGGAVTVQVGGLVVHLEPQEVQERADRHRELRQQHATHEHLDTFPLGEAELLQQQHLATDDLLPVQAPTEVGEAECHFEFLVSRSR